MNRVLWSQEGMFGKKARHKQARQVRGSKPSGRLHSTASVYIALPPRPRYPDARQAPATPLVYVHLPQPGRIGKRRTHRGYLRISPAWVSLFSVVGTVFAAIGLLNIMINTLHLSAYGTGQWRAEAAVHKPGSGPQPQDATTNEYQHALTREMVPRGDTDMINVNSGALAHKGLLDDVKVSAEKTVQKLKDGLGGRQVRIFNGTHAVVEKVIVQVDIISRNGHLLRTENITTDTLPPMGVRVIDLTNVLPDADIQCYIQEIRSRSLRTSLRAL